MSFASYIVVFLTGVVTLSLEIIGVRILAPFFGTTISVWTGMIGVILISIGAGYYAGGYLADRKLNKNVLFFIIIFVSLAVFAIIPFRNVALAVPVQLSPGFTSLVVASLLFLLPATLAGTITTYTIKFELKDVKSAGTINGALYGTSALGNIFGVFFTSYVLIPQLTTNAILAGLGAILLLSAITSRLLND